MHARLFALSLAPLFAGSLAHAQAPGEVAPQPPGAQPPGAQPAAPAPDSPCATPCGCSQPESVMANRWSVSLAVGQMSMAPESSPDSKTAFGIGELALRFRATPHLELELAVVGGREQLPDNQEGDREVNTAVFAARYRFRPEEAWNWFLMGGLGGASVTRHDATQQERDDATRPLGMLGIGIERRFHHFALQAEARAIGIGDKSRNGDTMVEPPTPQPNPGGPGIPAGTTTAPLPPGPLPPSPPSAPPPSDKQSGGSLTIGLSYYF
jgi:hypothetical protein